MDWADGQLPHPDERSTIAFYAPTIRWPSEPGTFLDPQRSTLNPLWDVAANTRRSYTYGHFPLYLLVIAGNMAVKLAPVADAIGAPDRYVDMLRIANGSPGFAWVGRMLMALADTITVLYMFLLGRRLYGRDAGLLAAALGAVTVLQIQLAHFFAVDPISTTFTIAAVYHALRLVETRSWRQAIITGVMAALAIACKFSAAPILAAPVVAGFIIWLRQRQEAKGGEQQGTSGVLAGGGSVGCRRTRICCDLALRSPRLGKLQPGGHQRARGDGARHRRFPLYPTISWHYALPLLHHGTSALGHGLGAGVAGLDSLRLGHPQSLVAPRPTGRMAHPLLARPLLSHHR